MFVQFQLRGDLEELRWLRAQSSRTRVGCWLDELIARAETEIAASENGTENGQSSSSSEQVAIAQELPPPAEPKKPLLPQIKLKNYGLSASLFAYFLRFKF